MVEFVSQVFSHYGIWGVITVTVCTMLVALAKYLYNKVSSHVNNGFETLATTITDKMSEQNNLLVNTINNQNDKLINYIINKDQTATKDHDTKLAERMDSSNKINEKLKDIVNFYNCDRAMILEFHNSYKNLSGVPFAKYTCTFERLAKGTKSIMHKIISLPFSSISHVVEDILSNNSRQVIYDNLDIIEDKNPVLYSLFVELKAKSCIYTAIYDDSNTIIGLLVTEFSNKLPNHVDFKELIIDAASLSSILNLKDK